METALAASVGGSGSNRRQKCGDLHSGQQEVERRANGANGVRWQEVEIMEMMDSAPGWDTAGPGTAEKAGGGETMFIVNLKFSTRVLGWPT